jgi:acyl-CoA reductase-like NAD-dependent aldehyde dehydrogenase
MAEVLPMILDIGETIKHLQTWMKEEVVNTPLLCAPATSKIVYEPLGTMLVIGSWNYPVMLTLSPLVGAIAAGNCVIVKPSEISAHCSTVMRKLIEEYCDPNHVKCIEGHVKVAIKLTQSKFDKIVFTGSTQKGRLVAQAAAKNLVPCLLELGGKCPLIVDESADIGWAALKIIYGKFANAG